MLIRSRTLSHALSLALVFAFGACKKDKEADKKEPAGAAEGNASAAKTSGEVPDKPTEEAKNNYQLEGSGPELYEKILVPPLFEPWAQDLIERVDLKPGEKVLDVATGTGIVARKAAEVVGEKGAITGLDINPKMLAVAKTAPAPDKPAIEWVEGDALKLPFKDKTYDVVFCQQALQFFPDQAQAIKEMHRVLKPGGRLAVSVWRGLEHNPYGKEFADVVSEKVSPEAGKETISPFGWDDAAALEKMMKDAGFKTAKVEAVTIGMKEGDLNTFVINDLLAYPTTGKTLAEWDTPKKDELVAAILEALSEYKKGETWEVPFSSNVGVATK